MTEPEFAPNSASKPLHFDAVLHPHRSLSTRGFWLLMAIVSIVCFGTGIAFMALGAWPVLGFLGLDVLAIYLAFRLSYRSGRLFETVKLGDEALGIRRVHPDGRIEQWSLPPNWLSVRVLDRTRGGAIRLRSHGQDVLIGRFLTADERAEVATALARALDRWRLAPHLKQG